MRIEAGLVNPPQRVKIGLLKLSDVKRHAAIVAGLRLSRREDKNGEKILVASVSAEPWVNSNEREDRPLRCAGYLLLHCVELY